MIFRVYRNVNDGKYSVQAASYKRGWRVIIHANYIRMNNVTFKVYEKARQRVIKDKKKNVHAFIVGSIDRTEPRDYNVDGMKRISYNPYKAGYFSYCENNMRIDAANTVILTPYGVYADG